MHDLLSGLDSPFESEGLGLGPGRPPIASTAHVTSRYAQTTYRFPVQTCSVVYSTLAHLC
jgi:hypothetical protein